MSKRVRQHRVSLSVSSFTKRNRPGSGDKEDVPPRVTFTEDNMLLKPRLTSKLQIRGLSGEIREDSRSAKTQRLTL